MFSIIYVRADISRAILNWFETLLQYIFLSITLSVFYSVMSDIHRRMRQSVLQSTALIECQRPNIVSAWHLFLSVRRSPYCCTWNKWHKNQYEWAKIQHLYKMFSGSSCIKHQLNFCTYSTWPYHWILYMYVFYNLFSSRRHQISLNVVGIVIYFVYVISHNLVD